MYWSSKLVSCNLIMIIIFSFQSIHSLNLYDNNLSHVMNLNPKNFDQQIIQNRPKNVVSIVHFYTLDGTWFLYKDGKSRGLKLEFEKFSSERDGMFKVGAVNCKSFRDICEKYDIREFPTFKVFPPLPAPIFNYEVYYINLGKNWEFSNN